MNGMMTTIFTIDNVVAKQDSSDVCILQPQHT